MSRFPRPALVFASIVGSFVAAAPAAAQVLVLRCAFPTNWEARVTVDHGARTMSVDQIDGGAITSFGFNNIPAQITEDRIVADLRRGDQWTQFSLNRYAGTLMRHMDLGAGSGAITSLPCVPYQRGPRQF